MSTKKSMVNAAEDMETASFPFILPIPFHSREASGVGRIDFTINSRSGVSFM